MCDYRCTDIEAITAMQTMGTDTFMCMLCHTKLVPIHITKGNTAIGRLRAEFERQIRDSGIRDILSSLKDVKLDGNHPDDLIESGKVTMHGPEDGDAGADVGTFVKQYGGVAVDVTGRMLKRRNIMPDPEPAVEDKDVLAALGATNDVEATAPGTAAIVAPSAAVKITPVQKADPTAATTTAAAPVVTPAAPPAPPPAPMTAAAMIEAQQHAAAAAATTAADDDDGGGIGGDEAYEEDYGEDVLVTVAGKQMYLSEVTEADEDLMTTDEYTRYANLIS